MPCHTKDSPSVLVLVLWLLTLSIDCTGLPSSHHIQMPQPDAATVPSDPSLLPGRPANDSTTGTDSNQSQEEETRIEAIKQSILATLHMAEPPSPEVIARAKANLTPEKLSDAWRLYESKIQEHQDGNAVSPTSRPPHHTRRKNIHKFHSVGSSRENVHFDRHSRPVTLFFSSDSVSTVGQVEDVADGKLKLFFRPRLVSHAHRHSKRTRRVKCSIYMFSHDENSATGEEPATRTKQLLESRILSVRSPGWKTFHITEAVRSWLASPDAELSLSVVVRGHSAEDLFYLEQGPAGSPSAAAALQPRVEVLYQEEAFRRMKREASNDYNCEPEDGVATCCRYRQNITFSELGWDTWIYYPPSYVSYQCMGECPINFRPASPYSRIKSLMHAIDPDDWNSPCCAPTKLSPTIYLMLNATGGLEVTAEENAVVDECRCL